MADDKEPETGDDPWAGLESEQLPDLNEGFAFSFEESSEAEPQSDEPARADATAGVASGEEAKASTSDDNVNEWLEEPEDASSTPELSVFHSDDDEPHADGDLWEAAASGPSSIDITSEHSGITNTADDESLKAPEPGAADDFGGDDSFAGAIAAEMFTEDVPEGAAVASHEATDMFEPGVAESGEDTDDEAGNAGGMFRFTESMESESTAGETGTSADQPMEADAFAFAGLGTADDDQEAEEGESAEGDASPFGETIDINEAMVATSSPDETGETGKKSPKSKRPAPAKKKKPNMFVEMLKIIGGGMMAIPIGLAILWWGLGKDIGVAPSVPDWLAFIVPAKLQTGSQRGVSAGGSTAPSLDDVVAAGAQESPDTGVTPDEPGTSDEPAPVLPAPESVEPPATDVAIVDPAPDAGAEGGDEVTDLLKDEVPSPVEPAPPAAAPEPEPLDIAALQAAADKAVAALAAVEGASDPADPVHKKVLVECYKALAGYAQELAMLERVATDTGRVLATMPAPVTAVNEAVSGRPELHAALARLTRDWLAYGRRSSDGVVAPVTFVSARQVGPYWRSEVTVGEKPLVVLTKTQPGAAPGESLLVTGLTVDKDVVWAVDVQPAKAADLFGL